MLQRGDHSRALQPADVGGAEDRHQVRIFTHRLLDPPPPVVTDHVEHGRQPLMHAERGHVAPDGRRHPLDQVRVEGGAPRQRGGVDGCAEAGQPGQALLVHQCRYAEPVVVEHHPLLADQLGRSLLRRDRDAAVHAGEMAEAVPARLARVSESPGGEHVLHRRDVERRVLVRARARYWTACRAPIGCRAARPSPRASSRAGARRPGRPPPARRPATDARPGRSGGPSEPSFVMCMLSSRPFPEMFRRPS